VDKEAIKQLAEILDAKLSTKTKKWWNLTCPLAEVRHQNGTDRTPSFGIKISPGKTSKMHCNSCSWNGDLVQLVYEMKYLKLPADYGAMLALSEAEIGDVPLQLLAKQDEEEAREFKPFSEDWLASFPTVFNSGHALHYLKSRKGGPVPPLVSAALDLRWDPHRQRVCFPLRDGKKVLAGFHGRAIKPYDEPKYLAYPYHGHVNWEVWLGEDKIDWDKPVVMAESVFDYARAYQVYRNVVSPLSASLTEEKLSRLLEAGELITMFDPDKAGNIARQKTTEYFKKASPFALVRHLHLDDHLDEEGQPRDGGALTVEEMAELLQKYVTLDKWLVD